MSYLAHARMSFGPCSISTVSRSQYGENSTCTPYDFRGPHGHQSISTSRYSIRSIYTHARTKVQISLAERHVVFTPVYERKMQACTGMKPLNRARLAFISYSRSWSWGSCRRLSSRSSSLSYFPSGRHTMPHAIFYAFSHQSSNAPMMSYEIQQSFTRMTRATFCMVALMDTRFIPLSSSSLLLPTPIPCHPFPSFCPSVLPQVPHPAGA